MTKANFFDTPSFNSIIKGNIVFEYFKYWSAVILASQNKYNKNGAIGYFDFYCGPGKYADKTSSTPVRIVENILSRPELRERMFLVFNDREKKSISALEDTLRGLPDYKKLTIEPYYSHDIVDDSIAEIFKGSMIPSLIFLDPFGIKGLSSTLYENIFPHWGCDVISFFNLSYTNRSISNSMMEKLIISIFGNKIDADMINNLKSRRERENFILTTFSEMLIRAGWNYIHTFRIEKDSQHVYYLVFISKNAKASKGIKEVFKNHATYRSCEEFKQFVFCYKGESLFALKLPCDLVEHLINNYQGRRMNLDELIEVDITKTPCVESEYKEALKYMADHNLLECHSKRRKNTFANTIQFTIL